MSTTAGHILPTFFLYYFYYSFLFCSRKLKVSGQAQRMRAVAITNVMSPVGLTVQKVPFLPWPPEEVRLRLGCHAFCPLCGNGLQSPLFGDPWDGNLWESVWLLEKEESLELCLAHFRKQEVGSEDTGVLGLDGPL